LLVEIARRLGACTFAFFTYERPSLSECLRKRLTAAFAEGGLDSERFLKWLPWQPRAAFLALMGRADVYLDTLRFSGFNTLLQAVEMSLPCVSYEGQHLRGRLGSGVLRQLGLTELIATDGASYVEIAVRLASDRHYRRDVARRMQAAGPRAYADRSAVEALEHSLLG
jgi:predicted O-linked N-acetylglucosamine transferase (SPINDLY family)